MGALKVKIQSINLTNIFDNRMLGNEKRRGTKGLEFLVKLLFVISAADILSKALFQSYASLYREGKR